MPSPGRIKQRLQLCEKRRQQCRATWKLLEHHVLVERVSAIADASQAIKCRDT
jgi:hypothetical protein